MRDGGARGVLRALLCLGSAKTTFPNLGQPSRSLRVLWPIYVSTPRGTVKQSLVSVTAGRVKGRGVMF